MTVQPWTPPGPEWVPGTWWRVAHLRPGAYTETRDDFADEATARVAAEALAGQGFAVVMYPVRLA